ncbi:phage tail tube protein [uncultured Duncaniella sp.]|uniref:phage tail tube protein n=1 Tax=uncultured Duncaniella sp. TaxID=2768039 RepID=UPI00267661E9|nr:phage tail tube protein [uncultured Duncaniella sp.]
MATTTKTGYCNGSDMLLYIGGKAVGHCTTHTTTINSETKERAVKPVAIEGISAGRWKNKGVVGLSVSISAEGLVFYQESETGYKSCLSMISKGQSVEVKCMERENADKPYLSGKFVIASLERVDAAQDDATYSISLENDGVVEFDETAITETAESTVEA